METIVDTFKRLQENNIQVNFPVYQAMPQEKGRSSTRKGKKFAITEPSTATEDDDFDEPVLRSGKSYIQKSVEASLKKEESQPQEFSAAASARDTQQDVAEYIKSEFEPLPLGRSRKKFPVRTGGLQQKNRLPPARLLRKPHKPTFHRLMNLNRKPETSAKLPAKSGNGNTRKLPPKAIPTALRDRIGNGNMKTAAMFKGLRGKIGSGNTKTVPKTTCKALKARTGNGNMRRKTTQNPTLLRCLPLPVLHRRFRKPRTTILPKHRLKQRPNSRLQPKA